MSATIYDVAARAGVSIATVSRALNAPHTVAPVTRQRVLQAVDELGFVPKAEATDRARRAHRRVGVLAPFFTYAAFVQRLRGVAAGLADFGYDLVVYNAETPDQVRGYLDSLPVSRRLDGLIVMSLCVDDSTERRLRGGSLPVVLIEATRRRLPGIDVDNRAGGQLAADYLLELGHRRLGFVGGDWEIPGYTLHTSQLRFQGFCARLKDHQIKPIVAELPRSSASFEDAQRQAAALFALPEPPSAIFAASDTMALGILSAAREVGLSIPDQLAVLGFDDLDVAEYVGLSSVSQSLETSGRQAVELLLAAMTERDELVRHVEMPLCVVPRSTT